MRFTSPIKSPGFTSVPGVLDIGRLRAKIILLSLAGMIVLLPGICRNVVAQQPANSPEVARLAERSDSRDDSRYRIGAGDVLAVIVRKAPELSLEAVRVDQRGMIRIPMIDHEVQAACQTESELAVQIASLYLEYKRNPSVDVFVREFQSRPVAVIGAVNTPGQFRLQRQVRLLELLTFAGGPSNAAGRIINIIHAGGQHLPER